MTIMLRKEGRKDLDGMRTVKGGGNSGLQTRWPGSKNLRAWARGLELGKPSARACMALWRRTLSSCVLSSPFCLLKSSGTNLFCPNPGLIRIPFTWAQLMIGKIIKSCHIFPFLTGVAVEWTLALLGDKKMAIVRLWLCLSVLKNVPRVNKLPCWFHRKHVWEVYVWNNN